MLSRVLYRFWLKISNSLRRETFEIVRVYTKKVGGVFFMELLSVFVFFFSNYCRSPSVAYSRDGPLFLDNSRCTRVTCRLDEDISARGDTKYSSKHGHVRTILFPISFFFHYYILTPYFSSYFPDCHLHIYFFPVLAPCQSSILGIRFCSNPSPPPSDRPAGRMTRGQRNVLFWSLAYLTSN